MTAHETSSDTRDGRDLHRSGMTRREMLRAGTLGGATALWMAPTASVYAMSQTVAEPTSGISTSDTTQPPRTSDTSQPSQKTETTQGSKTTDTTRPTETTESTQPSQTTETTQGSATETTKGSNTTGSSQGSEPTGTNQPGEQSPTDVLGTEVTATTVPDRPIADDATVGGKVVVADVDHPAIAAQTVTPPVIAQSELPQTGFDAERTALIGSALTGVGAALLAATREQPAD